MNRLTGQILLLAMVSASLFGGIGAVLAAPASSTAPAFVPPPMLVYTKDNASAAPNLESLPLKESVSQYGITWTFEKPARVGQFVNGDWYVVGLVTIKMIAPKPLFGDEVKETMDKGEIHESKYPGKQARHGSSLNPPSKAKTAGFDSRIPDERYDPNLFSHLPIAMKPGDSLVSTISRENSEIKCSTASTLTRCGWRRS